MTDMKDLGIWEPYTVKTQTYKTAVEVSGGDVVFLRLGSATRHAYGWVDFLMAGRDPDVCRGVICRLMHNFLKIIQNIKKEVNVPLTLVCGMR